MLHVICSVVVLFHNFGRNSSLTSQLRLLAQQLSQKDQQLTKALRDLEEMKKQYVACSNPVIGIFNVLTEILH